MIPEHVHANNRLVEVRICALRDIVVQMLFVAECIHALEDELKQCLQVLRAGTRDEDVRVPMRECSSDSQTKSGGLSTTTTSSKCDGRRQRLLSDSIDESDNSLNIYEYTQINR